MNQSPQRVDFVVVSLQQHNFRSAAIHKTGAYAGSRRIRLMIVPNLHLTKIVQISIGKSTTRIAVIIGSHWILMGKMKMLPNGADVWQSAFVSHFQCLSPAVFCIPGALPRALSLCAFGA